MFWIICGALTCFVGLAIAVPFLRKNSDLDDEPTAAYDLRIYRDQLREVERDLERGVIDPAEAERLRTEIGRKVLAADRAAEATAVPTTRHDSIGAMAVLALIVGGAFALYAYMGSPGLKDEPIVARYAEAEESYRNRPSQEEAEAKAPKPERPAPDANYAELIERLREAVAQNPDDPQGLMLLAQHEEQLGNLAAARKAAQHLLEVRGKEASADDHAALAALMTDAAGGTITPEAEEQIGTALAMDRTNPRARFLAGVLQWQNGRPDRAFPIWAALLAEGPDDAPWNRIIRERIPDLAWLAGEPNYTPPEPRAALPGPSAEDMAAAENLSPEERQEFVASMVKRLEARLATEGGTPDEWARLISSLVVIGQTDHARDILTEARGRFGSDAEASAMIEAAAKQAGLE